MALYAVTATRIVDGAVEQVPTFFLDEDVQGIVSESHARRVAAKVIGHDVVPESVCAVKI